MHLEPESLGRDGITVHSSVCYQMVCSAKSQNSVQTNNQEPFCKQLNAQNLLTPGLATYDYVI